jgi:hypothetical protein
MNEIELKNYSKFMDEASEYILIFEILNYRKELEWTPQLWNETLQNKNKLIEIATQTKLIEIEASKLYSHLLNCGDAKIDLIASIFRQILNNEIEYLKYLLERQSKNLKRGVAIKNYNSNIYKRARRHHIYFDEIIGEWMRDPYFNRLKLKK